MKTVYEWDYESVDEDGDITDHHHAEKLSMFSDIDKTDTLVLIRDTGSEYSGLEERVWAYVKDGKLPEYFKDARGVDTYKVPQRFHDELKKHLNQ